MNITHLKNRLKYVLLLPFQKCHHIIEDQHHWPGQRSRYSDLLWAGECRPAMGPTQPQAQWVSDLLPSGKMAG
jgi:hypothetical protein